VVSNVECIKQVLAARSGRGPVIRAMYVVASGVSGMEPDDDHRLLRRVFSPYFNQQSGVSKLHPILLRGCEQMEAFLTRNHEAEVQSLMARSLYDSFMGALLGVESNTLEANDLTNYNTWRRLNKVMMQIATVGFDFTWIPTAGTKQYKQDCRYILDGVREIIKKHTKEYAEGITDDSALTFALNNNPEDGSVHLDEQKLLNHMMNFLWASHDSTRNAASFAVYHLGTDEELQQRLRAEVLEHIGNRPSQPDDFNSMALLNGIVKELNRLYPGFPMFHRQVYEPVHLTGAGKGITVPPNAIVVINLFAAMRDPAVFPSPEQFIPERWMENSNSNGKGQGGVPLADMSALVTFGGGARRCLGEHLALHNLKTILVHLVQKFDLKVTSPFPGFTQAIAMEPLGPITLRATPRAHKTKGKEEGSRLMRHN